MAYAAIISLSNTIHRLLNHDRLSISLEENQQIRSLLEYVTSFQAFLESFPDKFNSLEGRMRELAHEAEDIIEYFMLEQVSLWRDCDETERAILWFKQFIENSDLFVKELMEICDISSSEGFECGADSSRHSSPSPAPPIRKDSTVGYEDHVIDIMDRLCSGEPSKLQVIPICGMAGTGKTILARNIYHDPSIIDHFVIRVWVTISQYSSVQKTLSSLLECLEEFNTSELGQSDEEKVYNILRGRRYLVVMDNLWSSKAWDVVMKIFPDDSNGSRIMITTRLCDVASYPVPSSKLYHMGLLSEDQSWNLLKNKVFADEGCPSELENIGKQIARRCKGWPLAVGAIAEILYTITRSDRSWEKISEVFFEELDLEKVISSFVNDSRCHPRAKHDLQLKKVIRDIDLVATEVKKIKGSSSSSSKDIERGGADSFRLNSSSPAPPTHKDSMVGFEDYVLVMKDRLCGQPSPLQVIPICGMGGIGKTTLARNLYDDPLIVNHFDVRIWVTISQDFSVQRIFSSILESLKKYNKGVNAQSDDEKVHKILMWRRYLVVMDDIWSSKAWDVVRRAFPDDVNGSRIMLTTRLFDMASYPDTSSKLCEMRLLNADQSWELLKQRVFADEDCPDELENTGKEIARRCEGLPLAIVVIAGLLSTACKNPASWMEIAEKVKSSETAEHNQIEDILSLSYTHLPQYLRPCFLYMGSFPEDDEIHVKKLIRLWIAEGFITSPTDSDSFEKVAEKCLEELVKRNLVLVAKRKFDGRIKRCSLHDLMRDLCIRKAHESKFFLIMMARDIEKQCFVESIKDQRRVSVDSSYLRYISSDDDSSIHSIRCAKYHLVKLEFVKSVRLLRVLDTEPADVESSPSVHQLCQLFHLRYLAIKYMESIPRGLSMLQNLQTLIIGREKRDKLGVGVVCYLELCWCMPQLRHVYFHGTIYFEDPQETTSSLESLQTLSHVTHESCTERILKRLPNLKKLKIDCSGSNVAAACLNDLEHLHRLENLKVFAGCWVGSRPKQYNITYPSLLKRLSLRDLILPWSDMTVVGSFPNLQVLKLKGCTFEDGKWETTEGAFPSLELLLIECWTFEDWKTETSHFPSLKRLQLHYCRALNEIPNDIGEIPTLELIEVKGDVKKSLVESAELIRTEQEELGNDTLQVLCSAEVF